MARKIGRIILNVLVCIILMAGVCLMVTTRWEINNIGQSRFDNILFSISNRLDGANLQYHCCGGDSGGVGDNIPG